MLSWRRRVTILSLLLGVFYSGCGTTAQVQRLSRLGLAVTRQLEKELEHRQNAIEQVPDLADLVAPLRGTPPANPSLEQQVAKIASQLALRGKALEALAGCYLQLLKFVSAANEQPVAQALTSLADAAESYASSVSGSRLGPSGGVASMIASVLSRRTLIASSRLIRARLEQLQEAMEKEWEAHRVFELSLLDQAFVNATFLLEKKLAVNLDVLQTQVEPLGIKLDEEACQGLMEDNIAHDAQLAERYRQIRHRGLKRRLERLKEKRALALKQQLAALHILIEQHRQFEAGAKIDFSSMREVLKDAPTDD